jgi:predicted NBD/HSP70 family sugar kinase
MRKATPQQTKEHNKRLVLKLIYDEGETSRADIARKTELTRTTVSSIVAEFIETKLVVEAGQAPSAGGKPPTWLKIDEDAFHCICADLGSQGFSGAIVNLRGEVKQRLNLPIENLDGEAALELVYQLVDALFDLAESPLLGIGIGTPGLMDAQKGIVRNAVNLDWQDLSLGELLTARYELPVYIANDSQAAALGEYTFGGERNGSSLIVIKLGRGIGAGIVLNGELFYGDGCGAGEIGHVSVIEGGEACMCGNYGCLETVASIRAILKRTQVIYKDDPDSILRQYASTPEQVNPELVLKAYLAGDQEVRHILHEANSYLGSAIANLVSALNIHRIVIAGEDLYSETEFIEYVRQQVRQRSLQALALETRIEPACLGDDIVIWGAAALLLKNELGII